MRRQLGARPEGHLIPRKETQLQCAPHSARTSKPEESALRTRKVSCGRKKPQGLVTGRLVSRVRRGLGALNHHRQEERWMRETRICHLVQRERRHAKHAVDFPPRSCTPLSDTENVSCN